MHDLSALIVSRIDSLADARKAEWWNNYLKHVISFKGVGIPEIRSILNTVTQPGQPLPEVANEMIRQDTAEYKLAGILIYQYYLLEDMDNTEILDNIEQLFSEKNIYDWNTCDWLCVRVLTPMINEKDGKATGRILNWCREVYLWQARASIVPFAQCRVLTEYLPVLKEPMQVLIRRKERFAKTAVGWVLRQAFRHDEEYVKAFLRKNASALTTEVINNSLKYMQKEEKRSFVARIR